MKSKIFYISTALFLLLIACIPALLSTSAGNSFVKRYLLPKEISFASAGFSWWSGQTIEKVSYQQSGATVFVQKITLQGPFFNLIRPKPRFEQITIDKLNGTIGGIVFENVDANCSLEQNGLALHLVGQVIKERQAEPFSVQANWQGVDPYRCTFSPNAELATTVENFPASALEPFLSKAFPRLSSIFPEIMGEKLSFQIQDRVTDDAVSFQFTANSQALAASFIGTIKDRRVLLTSPGSIQVKNKNIDLIVTSLELPLDDPQESTIALTLKDFPTHWVEKLYPHFPAQEILGSRLALHVSANPQKKELILSLRAEKLSIPEIAIRFDPRSQLPGKIIFTYNGRTEGNGIFSGNASYVQGKFDGLFHGEKIPSAYFPKEIKGAFGAAIDVDASGSIQNKSGPIRISLNGAVGRFDLDGELAQGILYLNSPINAEAKATPEFGRFVLAGISPLLESLIKSESPITIHIDREGFSLPLFPLQLEGATVRRAKIELGKLLFENRGELKKALSLIRPVASESISAWFTPLYFSIRNGVVSIPRFDFLVMNRYPMASWGKIDLHKDYVDMVVALSGFAVNEALQLGLNDTGFMLQLPLRGPVNNVKLETSNAAAKLAALSVKSQGSKAGLVLGTLLDLANGTILKESKVPPPTTNPLPWGTIAPQKDANQEDPQEDQSENKPVIKLKKAAENVLKKIFK